MKKGFILLVCLVLLVGFAFAGDEYAKVINKSTPGMPIDISKYKVDGKITIFDFYSRYCGPCMRLAPYLEKLDRKRDDIVVYKVNINRPGVRGIDWKSPVARQYRIRAIPYFVIYDKDGRIISAGRPATQKVLQYMREAGIE